MALPGGEDDLVARLTQRLLSIINPAPEAGAALSIDPTGALNVFQETLKYHREHQGNIMRRNLGTAEEVDLTDQTQEAPYYMKASYLFTHFADTMHLGRQDASVLSCPQPRFFMDSDGSHRDPDFAQYAFFVNRDGGYEQIKVLGTWAEVKPYRPPGAQALQNHEAATDATGSEESEESGESRGAANESSGVTDESDELADVSEGLSDESEGVDLAAPTHIVDLINNRVQLSEQSQRALANYHGDSILMFFMHGHHFSALLYIRPEPIDTANAAQDPSLLGTPSTSDIPPTLPGLEPLDPRTFQGTHFWKSEVAELLTSCAETRIEKFWVWVKKKYPEFTPAALEDLRKRFDGEMTAQKLVSMHPQPVYVAAPILEGNGDSLRASHPFTNTLRLAHSSMTAEVTFEESVFFCLAQNEPAYKPSDEDMENMVDLMARWYTKTLYDVWLHELEDARESFVKSADSSLEVPKPKNSRLDAIVRSPPRLRPRKSVEVFGEQPLADASGELDGDDSALAGLGREPGHVQFPSTHTGSVDPGAHVTGNAPVAAASLPDAASHTSAPASPPPGAISTTSQPDVANDGDAPLPHDDSALGGSGGGHGGTQPLSMPPIGAGTTLGAVGPVSEPSIIDPFNVLDSMLKFGSVGPPAAFSTPVLARMQNARGDAPSALAGPSKGISHAASFAGRSTNTETSAPNAGSREQAMAGTSRLRSEGTTPGYLKHTQASLAKGKAPAKNGPPRKNVKRKKRSEPDDSAAYEPPGQPKKKAKMGQPR